MLGVFFQMKDQHTEETEGKFSENNTIMQKDFQDLIT